jgi:glycosyltransferase 2 family protein
MPVEKPRPASPRQFGGLALRVVVSFGILAWLGSRMDWSHVVEAFRGLRWGYWVAAVGLYVACQLLCCIRWMWLSRPLGFTQSPARFSSIYFVGMFFNLFLPTSVGGDAVRAVYLANGSGRRLPAILSVLLDRLSGVVVLIGVACVAASLSPIELPQQFRLTIYGLGSCAGIGLLSLPLLARLSHVLPAQNKLRRMIGRVRESVKLLRSRPDILFGTTLLSIVVQVLNAVVVWLVGLALNLDVPAVYYGVAAPMVTLVTLIPISLNGMGLREGGMVLFLGPAGASAANAVTLAFLWFLVQTTASLFGAVVYLFGHFSRPEGLPDE